jgi:hypothetical protein
MRGISYLKNIHSTAFSSSCVQSLQDGLEAVLSEGRGERSMQLEGSALLKSLEALFGLRTILYRDEVEDSGIVPRTKEFLLKTTDSKVHSNSMRYALQEVVKSDAFYSLVDNILGLGIDIDDTYIRLIINNSNKDRLIASIYNSLTSVTSGGETFDSFVEALIKAANPQQRNQLKERVLKYLNNADTRNLALNTYMDIPRALGVLNRLQSNSGFSATVDDLFVLEKVLERNRDFEESLDSDITKNVHGLLTGSLETCLLGTPKESLRDKVVDSVSRINDISYDELHASFSELCDLTLGDRKRRGRDAKWLELNRLCANLDVALGRYEIKAITPKDSAREIEKMARDVDLCWDTDEFSRFSDSYMQDIKDSGGTVILGIKNYRSGEYVAFSRAFIGIDGNSKKYLHIDIIEGKNWSHGPLEFERALDIRDPYPFWLSLASFIRVAKSIGVSYISAGDIGVSGVFRSLGLSQKKIKRKYANYKIGMGAASNPDCNRVKAYYFNREQYRALPV